MGASAESSARRCAVCHQAYGGGERFCPIDGGAITGDDQTEDREIGRTIDGRYFIRRLLGRGGMGAVYEADHVGLDKRVAIKFIARDGADAETRARFRREARAASKVVHEHVVQIFDIGIDDAGTDYIAMEYLEGRDLRHVLNDGALEPDRAVRIAKQMLLGLQAIHDAGIIHRDIKPANVLLTHDTDFVKIMDFGIAKSFDSSTETLTNTGRVIGTPQYMAPEQIVDGEVDHRADLYAVGVTLYAMLSGEVPFAGTTFGKLAGFHANAVPRPIREVRRGVPPPVAAAIERSLAKTAARRFSSAKDFIRALDGERLDEPRGAETTPLRARVRPSDPGTSQAAATIMDRPRPRSSMWVALALCMLVTAGAVGALIIVKSSRAPTTPPAAIGMTPRDAAGVREPAPVAVTAPDAGVPVIVAVPPSDAAIKPAPKHRDPTAASDYAGRSDPGESHEDLAGSDADPTDAVRLADAKAAVKSADWIRADRIAAGIATSQSSSPTQRLEAIAIRGIVACRQANSEENALIAARRLESSRKLRTWLLDECHAGGLLRETH